MSSCAHLRRAEASHAEIEVNRHKVRYAHQADGVHRTETGQLIARVEPALGLEVTRFHGCPRSVVVHAVLLGLGITNKVRVESIVAGGSPLRRRCVVHGNVHGRGRAPRPLRICGIEPQHHAPVLVPVAVQLGSALAGTRECVDMTFGAKLAAGVLEAALVVAGAWGSHRRLLTGCHPREAIERTRQFAIVANDHGGCRRGCAQRER